MRRVMQVLGILLVISLLYAIVAGLGLTRVFKHRKDVKKTQVLNDFEYLRDDFDWTTGGYAKIEPSTENQTHGKKSAKVSFFATRQFFVTPVPGNPPTNSSQVLYSEAGRDKWRPEILIDTHSVTKLSAFEWQEFGSFKMDVYNDQAQPVTYHIQIVDSRSFVFENSGPLTPKKVTNISVPLDDLIRERMDLTNIRSLKFSVDMAGQPDPLVVFIDNLRLEGDATPIGSGAKKGVVVMTPTPKP